MTQDTHDRLARYAIFSALHGVVFVAAMAGLWGNGAYWMLLVASLPLLWACGAFHGDLAMNEQVDEAERSRWRIALWFMPWSMTLYWYRYVRPRQTYRV